MLIGFEFGLLLRLRAVVWLSVVGIVVCDFDCLCCCACLFAFACV